MLPDSFSLKGGNILPDSFFLLGCIMLPDCLFLGGGVLNCSLLHIYIFIDGNSYSAQQKGFSLAERGVRGGYY